MRSFFLFFFQYSSEREKTESILSLQKSKMNEFKIGPQRKPSPSRDYLIEIKISNLKGRSTLRNGKHLEMFQWGAEEIWKWGNKGNYSHNGDIIQGTGGRASSSSRCLIIRDIHGRKEMNVANLGFGLSTNLVFIKRGIRNALNASFLTDRVVKIIERPSENFNIGAILKYIFIFFDLEIHFVPEHSCSHH